MSIIALMKSKPKSDIDMYISDRVKNLRNKHGISQAVLATKLGLSDAFIGQCENPKLTSKYSMVQLNMLAKIFECSPKDFLPDTPL
jgi:transcriptional regulator with XRE-family HTH domain